MLRVLATLALLAVACGDPLEPALWIEDCLVFYDPAYGATVSHVHAANCGDPEALGTSIRR